MSDVLHFFDPRPLQGLLLPVDAPPCYPTSLDADARQVELVDVSLEPSGEFILTVQEDGQAPTQWRGMARVLHGEDDSIGLAIGERGQLLFPASERGRVTDLFMKLANHIIY